MDRCEYCEFRNSWDCDDGWYRTSNDSLCENFKLDFDRLTYNQKKAVQRILMGKRDNGYDYE